MRRIDDLELQRIAARDWPGLRNEWHAGWLLRAGGGWTGRANSALPLAEVGDRLDMVLDRVVHWYAGQDLAPTIQVPLPARDDLRSALRSRGWTERWGAMVMTAEVDAALMRVAETGPGRITVADEPDGAWLAAYHHRGGPLPAVAPAVLRAGTRPRFLAVVEAGLTVAICRVTSDGAWIGLTAMEVEERHRRRGLATRMLAAALRMAREEGITRAYLQVEEDNRAARRLYERVGFVAHHTYRYYRPGAVR